MNPLRPGAAPLGTYEYMGLLRSIMRPSGISWTILDLVLACKAFHNPSGPRETLSGRVIGPTIISVGHIVLECAFEDLGWTPTNLSLPLCATLTDQNWWDKPGEVFSFLTGVTSVTH